MPCGPRLDAPGTLHHVMVRGIERTAIFRDPRDRTDFHGRRRPLPAAPALCCALAHHGYLIQKGEIAGAGTATQPRDSDLVRHAYLTA